MNTPVFNAILFFISATLCIAMTVGYFQMRRAMTERPDDPKFARARPLMWIYPVGVGASLLTAVMSFIDWMA